jgi:anti-sigma regulatory factor (Ser/Thr protein kinase)
VIRTADHPNLKLELWSRAGDVVIVRQALAAIVELLELDAAQAADVATVVTEACNNVVVHAYPPDQPGPMTVEFEIEPHALRVTVSDIGSGIQPRPVEHAVGGGGLGVPMMLTLADAVRFSEPGETHGTRVQLEFNIAAVDPELVLGTPGWTNRPLLDSDHLAAGGAVLTARPGRLAAVALARVARVLACRARFTAAGLEDVDRVSRRIAGEITSEGPGRALSCGIAVGDREIELCTHARLDSTGRAEPVVQIRCETGVTRAMLGAH